MNMFGRGSAPNPVSSAGPINLAGPAQPSGPAGAAAAPPPDLDEVKLPDGPLIDVRHYPPGAFIPRPNVVKFIAADRKFTIPIGRNTVTVSDTDFELHRLESPCNIACCGARVAENTHLSDVRLFRHSLGDRSFSVLVRIILLSALIGVAVFFGMDSKTNTEDTRKGAAIGISVPLFLILFVLWFLDRKAFFGLMTDSAEGSPIEASIAPEGIKVSQFKVEQLLTVAWAAWARYRGLPVFDPLTIAKEGSASSAAAGGGGSSRADPNTDFTHRSCGAPAGSESLTVVDQHAVVIRKTAGFLNLPLFSASVWEGFWIDDVQWLHTTLGGRTRRGFYGALVGGIAVGAGIAFGAYDGKQRDAGDATGPAAAGGVIVGLLLLVRWFFSAITHIQFGITEKIQPVVRVAQLGITDAFEASTRALFRRPVDTKTEVKKICGKDAAGNQVELLVTPDITEIRIFSGAKTACEKIICRLCTDQSTFRCRTRDLKFVYSSIASLVSAIVAAFTYLIIGIVVTVLLVPRIEKTPEAIDKGKQMGIGISFGIAALTIISAILKRKSIIVLGTPLTKPMPPLQRALDALGFLAPSAKFLYRVEFVSLTMSPEDTVTAIADAVRAAKAKYHPVDLAPLTIPQSTADPSGGTTTIVMLPQQQQQQQQSAAASGAAKSGAGGYSISLPSMSNTSADPTAPQATGRDGPGLVVVNPMAAASTTVTVITTTTTEGHHHPHAPTAGHAVEHTHIPTGPHADAHRDAKKAAPAALPEGWEELMTEDGEVYYSNIYTGDSEWDRPTAPAPRPAAKGAKKQQKQLPPGWEKMTTDDGEVYYYHEGRDESSWDFPTA